MGRHGGSTGGHFRSDGLPPSCHSTGAFGSNYPPAVIGVHSLQCHLRLALGGCPAGSPPTPAPKWEEDALSVSVSVPNVPQYPLVPFGRAS